MSLRTIVLWCAVLGVGYYLWTGAGNSGSRGWNLPSNNGKSASTTHASNSSWLSFPAPLVDFFSSGSGRPSWSRFSLGSATLDCPCELAPLPDLRPLPQKQLVRLDKFKGATPVCEITFTHAFYPILRGELMLDTFSRDLDMLAPGLDFSRYPSQSGAVIVNGLRARRFDFDHLQDSVIHRVRYVFFSKGNDAWAIGVDCPVDSPEVEQTFLKMADSLRPD